MKSAPTRLVRDVIKQNLYKSSGYFSKQNPIMSPSAPINFTNISNFQHWQRLQQELFYDRAEQGQQFLTQCELFKPHYSQLLADWAVTRMRARNHTRLNIVEVGGGTGSNALHFLNHIQDRHPALYETMTYTLCEQTDTLCEAQTQLLSRDHSRVCRFFHKDFLTWQTTMREPTVLFLLEVLDNLPHDKISMENKFALQQVEINSHGQEVCAPLTDRWIKEAVHYFIAAKQHGTAKIRAVPGEDWYHRFLRYIAVLRRRRCEKRAKTEFVPSSAMLLLHTLNERFPVHDVFMSDFAYLPFPEILASKENINVVGSVFEGRNVPIVSGTDAKTGARRDFASYLTPNADVFFQTDFPLLANAYESVTLHGNAEVFTHRAFLEQQVTQEMREKTSTKSGYNPMIEDFRNISVLIGSKG